MRLHSLDVEYAHMKNVSPFQLTVRIILCDEMHPTCQAIHKIFIISVCGIYEMYIKNFMYLVTQKLKIYVHLS